MYWISYDKWSISEGDMIVTGIVEDIIQSFQNLFEMILGVFDFEISGKNIRLELIDLLEQFVFVALLFLSFKVIFSKTASYKGKFILITLFILSYLVAQFWVF